MSFQCINSFTSENGSHYRLHQAISRGAYKNLPPSEQDNFIGEEFTEDEDEGSDILDAALDIGLGIGIASILDNDDSPDLGSGGNDNDFGGFGGGDFGGGGASSDY